MARPTQKGLSYFSLDVGFRKDKAVRLLLQEFGDKGLSVLLSLWELCYSENGYYTFWDEDNGLLIASDIGNGCTAQRVQEVLAGCLRRSIFDAGVFQAFGVLTSKGVQKRYFMALKETIVRAAADGRHKEVYTELCLLSKMDFREIFRKRWTNGLIKFTHFSDKPGETANYSTINRGYSTNNAAKKKEKEEIERERETETETETPEQPAGSGGGDYLPCLHLFEKIKGAPFTEFESDIVIDLVAAYGQPWVLEALEIMGKAGKVKPNYAEGVLRRWQTNGKGAKPQAAVGKTFDELAAEAKRLAAGEVD